MGKPMAKNLLKAVHDLVVFDVEKEHTQHVKISRVVFMRSATASYQIVDAVVEDEKALSICEEVVKLIVS
jgi:3-hydroxyisobutyrate dehydrogenase-like beta-hydroxyacid dehydrogenase